MKIELDANQVAVCIRDAGIGFMFAPAHHPAMKNVGPTRVELGTRTIFNLLGPLSNPASVKRQMIGTFSKHWVEPMAQVLKNLGSESIWVVHGSDGLDEITTSGPTSVAALENGKIRTFEVTPGRCRFVALEAGGACVAATPSTTRRHCSTFSKASEAPFATWQSSMPQQRSSSRARQRILKQGAALAAKSIETGEAEGRLDRLIAVSNAMEA